MVDGLTLITSNIVYALQLQCICITLVAMQDEQISARLPRHVYRELERHARARGVPKSMLVREAIEQYLAAGAVTDAPSAWQRVSGLVGSLRLDAARLERDALARQLREHNWRD